MLLITACTCLSEIFQKEPSPGSTGYMVCGAQSKGNMWGSVFKNDTNFKMVTDNRTFNQV